MDDSQVNSIILAGILLIVYEVIVILAFYFLAPAVMMILYAIFNMDITLANHGAMYAPEFYFVTDMMFALSFLIPVVWFILWVFRIEAGNQMYVIRR